MTEIKFTNGMLYAFNSNQSIAKLLSTSINDAEIRLKLFTATSIIRQSPHFVGLQELLSEMAKKNKNLKIEDPEVAKIFALESDVKLEKIQIKIDLLPAEFTPADMLATEWLVDYVA